MKLRFFSVLPVALFLSLGCQMFSQWTTIHNLSQTSTGVMHVSESEVWATTPNYGGNPGQAKHSVDGGSTWEGQETGIPSGGGSNLRDVASPDSVDIFMIGNDGHLCRNNGMDEWELQNLDSNILRDIHFVNASTGYVRGDNVLYKTTDGGDTWVDISISETLEGISYAHFIEPNIGFLFKNGLGPGVWRSTDGGTSWDYIEFELPDDLTFLDIRDADFIDDQTGFAIGGTYGYVLKTEDAGLTWSFIETGDDDTFQSIDFANGIVGFAAGWYNSVIMTVDGGDSWSQMTTDVPDDMLLHEIDFFGTHGLMTANSGQVMEYILADVAGCTDSEACNYDPAATSDDGTCEYLETYEIVGQLVPLPGITHLYEYTETVGSSYTWTVVGGTITSGQGTASVDVVWDDVLTSEICVVETSADGCVGPAICLEVDVDGTHIPAIDDYSLGLFPNPVLAGDEVSIMFVSNIAWCGVGTTGHSSKKDPLIALVEFLDYSGRAVRSESRPQRKVSTSGLSIGMYFVKVTTTKGEFIVEPLIIR